MTEGESKPKALTAQPTVPPTDAERALARKLGRALGRQPTGAPISSRSHMPIAPSSPPKSSVPKSPVPSSAPKSTDAPPSSSEFSAEKEAMLAARRASLNPTAGETKSIRPTAPPAPSKPKTRKSFLALGVLILLGGLAAGGVYLQQQLRERSPEGQVRNALMSWEFAIEPSERDEAFGKLDQGAPSTVALTIELLSDTSRAERGDSNSQHAMQVLAHHYLVHYAALVKAPPPRAATELGKKLIEASAVPASTWSEARDAWRAWLTEQQEKGVVPKG